jgi:hypothetical protein
MSGRSARVYNRVVSYSELDDWGPIFATPGAQFVNLQYDDCEDEIRTAEDKFGTRIHRWADLDLRNDFENIAALVANLDVVMAPNTAILELAGALGVAGWYFCRVPIAYDYWRMSDETGADRLYPSVTQIRGERLHDTPALIAAVVTKIRSTFGNSCHDTLKCGASRAS